MKKIEYCENSLLFPHKLFNPNDKNSSYFFTKYYLNFLNGCGEDGWICLNPIYDTIEFFIHQKENYLTFDDIQHEFLFYREIEDLS